MAHQRTSQTLPQEFYLPSTPPADLTGFALHILSEKRVVGSSLRRHNAIRANLKYDTVHTESRQIGKYTAFASTQLSNAKPRRYSDITRNCSAPGKVLADARGAPLAVEPSEDAKARLAELRQARSSARIQARGTRERAESRTASRLAPGEDALLAARSTVLMARAAREEAMRQQKEHFQVLFDVY